MCIHHPESLRGNQTQTFPLFLGYDLNKPSLLSSTGMVEVRLWAIPGFSPTRGFWEIYCKDKVTDDQGFSEQQTEAITEKCIWNHMDIYICISKNIPHNETCCRWLLLEETTLLLKLTATACSGRHPKKQLVFPSAFELLDKILQRWQ